MDTRNQLADKGYRPEDDGKADFIKKVKGVSTFSDAKFFKTVFVSGDDMVAEENALKQKELEDWEKKVVVANKHFAVNTKFLESQQIGKYKSLREDPVRKIGFRLS